MKLSNKNIKKIQIKMAQRIDTDYIYNIILINTVYIAYIVFCRVKTGFCISAEKYYRFRIFRFKASTAYNSGVLFNFGIYFIIFFIKLRFITLIKSFEYALSDKNIQYFL